MRILLTGSTGYIGSVLLERLVASGHEVTAVVRTPEAAARVVAAGARAAEGDLADTAWFAGLLADADAAAHLAAPAEGVAALNEAVVDAAIDAYASTGRRFVLTSGIWLWGSASDITEETPPRAPELVAWRVPVEERLLASDVDATVLAPAVVYGRGTGLLGLITDGARTPEGALRLIGDGEQHWSWVHVEDLAVLYELALTHPAASGRLIASDGAPARVREIAERAAGDAGVAAEGAGASRERLGAAFADALLLDQRAGGERARSLGWTPVHTSVLDEVAVAASVS
ncbi:nucleoside-diphosphate-sugar epimerase [Microbacterium sp. BE35]|uniref:NAD-dependent epimerase/dehydratase family protein n=1 Tax=Microbacterium sp. BE35 TaxID=2817773 RepID=UPI00285CB7FC|nr:NAD-dependent epimerase/dehydratase family protein [Microbacterium sp. BE35]MDR7190646.1 nucleoside-diphosphate-sugar epimerase [Microbacterium sp. BE35]